MGYDPYRAEWDAAKRELPWTMPTTAASAVVAVELGPRLGWWLTALAVLFTVVLVTLLVSAVRGRLDRRGRAGLSRESGEERRLVRREGIEPPTRWLGVHMDLQVA